jgi:bacillithiol biosynthesis cysteine-adding enzyme BshC
LSSTTPDPSIWQALTSSEAGQVRPWLRWHPTELDECIAARANCLPSPLAPDEIEAMLEAHERWGADPATLAHVRALGDDRARVVVSGQQPGLLGGPLYTLYKALGSINLAQALQARHPQLKFIPVFWVASEDHDYNEVAAVSWPEAGGDLRTFRAEHPDAVPGRMVGTLTAQPVIEPLIEAIQSGTHETEFRQSEIDHLRESARDANWEDLFCRLMLRLTRDTGLVLISPLMPWVRLRSVPVFRKEIESAGESTRRVLDRSSEVASAGLPAPLHRNPGAVNFFHVDSSWRRRPVRFDADYLDCEKGEKTEARESVRGRKSDWLRRLEESPESFSTNVVTRPLTQDAILPTVAQLVGPGEAAYFAQVEAVYESFGVFAPVRYPRPRALLIARNVQRTLAKYDLDPLQTIDRDVKALVKHIQHAAGDNGFVEALVALRGRQEAELRELQKTLGKGGGANAAVDRLIQSMGKGFENIAQRHADDRRREEPQLESTMIRLLANLSPGGVPQERILNPVVPFLVNYGPSWIETFRAALSVDPQRGLQIHQLGS